MDVVLWVASGLLFLRLTLRQDLDILLLELDGKEANHWARPGEGQHIEKRFSRYSLRTWPSLLGLVCPTYLLSTYLLVALLAFWLLSLRCAALPGWAATLSTGSLFRHLLVG
jgi:hypothetical protein